MIVNSGKWPCGICGKRVHANPVQCTVCKRIINGAVVCVVTIQEVELAEDLMVNGETYECVKSFCYLGDTLDGDGR